ncbi:MAG: circadian clock protein KaiC [Limnospira sp.]
MNDYSDDFIEKLETGIPGFDFLADGGLPQERATLIAGTAGSAKTVFACQFLVEGIRRGEPGVFITFEEPPKAIRRNMRGFGWNIEEWEAKRQWVFVDASPQPGEKPMVTGEYDLGALLARIEFAIRKYKAKRVSMDSLGAIFSHLADTAQVRSDLFRIASALRELEVTAIMTAERTEEYGEISRYGVEEFVADNVVLLRNVLSDEKRRRTIEILKYRGTDHQKGEFPFTVVPGQGVVIIPLSAIELEQRSSNIRITSGSIELDRMCDGGFFRDSIILVSGATGTGKTLMVTEFMAGGVANQERCLLFAFEESREQLYRNAVGWGVDFERAEKEEMLKVVCRYPESTGLENHLIKMKEIIKEFRPNRVAVDSLLALERVSTLKGFRDLIIGLTSFIKQQEVGGLFTSTTPTLMGGTSITEAHISTITDSIILLRYVEMYGEMRRGITVLKMRGSMHDKDIREFSIDGKGMHIGKPFRNVTGILAGTPMYVAQSEVDRLSGLFEGGGEMT